MLLQTEKNWEKICRQLQDIETHTAESYLGEKKNQNSIILKHDVECAGERALNIALIEAKYGLKATFYFQASVLRETPEVVIKIGELGHEVAYHYDVLDECDGDYVKAAQLFSEALQEFSEIGFPVKTVCPHGNPVKVRDGWSSNKDFFRNKEIREHFNDLKDIVVDAKLIFGEEFNYITDAGYTWYKVGSITDNDKKNIPDLEIDDLEYFFEDISAPTVISSHPHRWHSSPIKAWVQRSSFFVLRKLARWLVKIPILEKLMSRFYFLAKKA